MLDFRAVPIRLFLLVSLGNSALITRIRVDTYAYTLRCRYHVGARIRRALNSFCGQVEILSTESSSPSLS